MRHGSLESIEIRMQEFCKNKQCIIQSKPQIPNTRKGNLILPELEIISLIVINHKRYPKNLDDMISPYRYL